MFAGEKLVRRSQVRFSSRLFARRGAESFFPLPFFFGFKSSISLLRRTSASYALRGARQRAPPGRRWCCWTESVGEVVVVQKGTRSSHMSFMSLVRLDLLLPWFLFSVLKGLPRFRAVLGTLKHAQIAAIEWNRQAIARVKTGMDVSCKLGSESISRFASGCY